MSATVERVGESILVTMDDGSTICMTLKFAVDLGAALLKVVSFGVDQLDHVETALGGESG